MFYLHYKNAFLVEKCHMSHWKMAYEPLPVEVLKCKQVAHMTFFNQEVHFIM